MIAEVGSRVQARFWAGLGEARRASLTAVPGWEARLEAAHAEARGAWPPGWLDDEAFAGELSARLEGDGAETPRWWEHLHAADLFLASACARGVAGALDRFERLHGDEIARIARRFERPGLPADDLVQQLRTKLFASGEEGPRIASYTGQGFLQNWLRVTATRTFIDCGRGRAEVSELPIGAGLQAVLAEPGPDPELELLKREHVAHFRAAFAEAIGALDSSDRLVLKQHLVERLTIDQIGGLYHLHRATAARRLARAREALLGATRSALARRLELPLERLVGVLDLLASRLEVSVERLLG